MTVLGAFHTGTSPMHRLPAWSKVLLIAGWGVVTVLLSDPVSAVSLAVAALLLLVSILPPWRPTVRGIALFAAMAALAAAYQVYRGNVGGAVEIAADLLGLCAVSLAVTGSTPMGELLELAAAAARPLRRVLPPAIPGLMFAIMLRVIPQVATIMAEAKEAARARGIERSVTALMIPTATRSVGFALDLGAALHARGIGDDAIAGAEPVLNR